VSSNASIRQQITEQIVKAIENNTTLPWRKPWRSSPNAGRAANVVSKKSYSGVNPLLLQVHSEQHGFESKWWATYRQWQTLGCAVKRRPAHVPSGEWGTKIVFYKPISKKKTDEAGQETEDRFFLLKQFTVFNADQVDGADEFQVQQDDNADDFPSFAPADELIEASNAIIQHGGDRAFYLRPISEDAWPDHDGGDFIQMPPKHRFDPVGAYYESLLHELAHWSEIRVGWDHREHGYAMCELVAEMASSFLATELGVPQGETLDNHAAYIRSWLAEMLDDSSFIFAASKQASKVADFVLGFAEAKNVSQTQPSGV
jgi:antirestriction protein ArdC